MLEQAVALGVGQGGQTEQGKEGFIAYYRRDFELLSAPLQGLPVEVLESTFVKGTRPKVRAELRLMRPHGLGQIMELAQLIENCKVLIREVRDQLGPRIGGTYAAKIGKLIGHFQTRAVVVKEHPSVLNREFPSKRLSESEWQA